MLTWYSTAKQGRVSQYFLKTVQEIKLSLSFSKSGTPSKLQNMHYSWSFGHAYSFQGRKCLFLEEKNKREVNQLIS